MKTNKNCTCGCGVTSAILGIIFGIVIAVLFSFGYFSFIFPGLWIAFSVAAATLVYIMILAPTSACEGCTQLFECLRKNLSCLLVGALGTIIFVIAALTTTLLIESTASIILIGIVGFFFVFLLSSIISFFKCLI